MVSAPLFDIPFAPTQGNKPEQWNTAMKRETYIVGMTLAVILSSAAIYSRRHPILYPQSQSSSQMYSVSSQMNSILRSWRPKFCTRVNKDKSLILRLQVDMNNHIDFAVSSNIAKF
jgi:hypothetical protein